MNYAEWPLSAPVNLTWEITHKCNLNCIHCLSDSRTEWAYELTLEECKSVVDQMSALGIFVINFGGGEPLLKNFFMSLLDYIHSKGIVTCISTNGTVVNDHAVSHFSNNPLVRIQVSLDGATPEVNDSIRGIGTFHQALKGIEILTKKNVPLSINTVVTSINFEQLSKLKDLADSFGAGFRLSRFRPSGRAKGTWNELKLNSTQLRDLSNWLNRHPDTLTGDSFFSISDHTVDKLGLNMCGACKLTCCVDPCGSVFPCAFLQEDEFYAGNLKRTPFKEIWDSSPVFQKFRRLEPELCSRCPYFSKCRGGCPAIAHFVRKDLNSADPECLISYIKDISTIGTT